jgi:hypothetical protein
MTAKICVKRLAGFAITFVLVLQMNAAAGLPLPQMEQPVAKLSGQLLNIGADNVSPAGKLTECQGRWQSSQNLAYLDWLTGLEAYAAYQDPTESGCTNTYPFGVVSVIWPVYVRVPTQIRLYPAIVQDAVDSVGCHFPGASICLGTDTLINLTDTGLQTLEIFLHDTCCVKGPYFVGVAIDTFLGTGLVDIVVDSGLEARVCATYNDYGHGMSDLVTTSSFTNNLKLWSRGVNAAQNQCFCCKGSTGNIDCDPLEGIDISDLSRLIDNLFISFAPLCCDAAANCDDQPGIDIGDLSRLIDFLYISFLPLNACP